MAMSLTDTDREKLKKRVERLSHSRRMFADFIAQLQPLHPKIEQSVWREFLKASKVTQ